MLDPRREQLVLAVLEGPRPVFPQEVRKQISEALAALVLQVAEPELDGNDVAMEVDDEGAC